jgi:hypothetical protein
MTHEPKQPRLRFRFRLRTLLLLPVLVAAGWWWAEWPERTARSFAAAAIYRDAIAARNLMAAGHADAPALSWIFKDSIEEPDRKGVTLDYLDVDSEYPTRTLSDYCAGRRAIKLIVRWKGEVPKDPNNRTVTSSSNYWFIARRGEIVPDPSKPQPRR